MGWLKKIVKGVKNIVSPIFSILKPIGKLLKKWLAPKLPDKEGLKIQRKGSDFFIPVVYGRREVGAIVVDTNVTDASGGAENEFFHVLAVFSYGEIDAFEEFFFNGISENDPQWRKDKNDPNSAKWFTKEVRLGTVDQTAVNAVGKLNRFSTTTSKYESIAHAFFTFQQDADQTIWNGEPEITVVMRGVKCFDPRTLTTAYTENGALHLLDYIKSPIYGKGLSNADLNLESFIAVANLCDTTQVATVDTLTCQTVNGVYSCTGSPAELVIFKRFSNNTIIDTERTVFDNMLEIADSFRGFFPEGNGLINIACEKEETPVYSFTGSNILSSLTSTRPGRNERYNRVIVRFPNIANKYEMDEVSFPDVGDALYQQWLTEDNELPQELVITAEYCVYKALAKQLAEVAAKVSRNAEVVTFTSDTLAMELDVGDVVTLSEENRGWVDRTFRISDIEYREDGYVDITAIQHENGAYPWSNISYTEIVGGSNLGDPTNIPAPTNLTITPDSTFATAGTLTWQALNNAFIRRYEVTVLQGSTVVYRTETLGKVWSIPLLAANTYSITVRSVSTLGTLSPSASIAFQLVQPVPPTDIDFTVSNFEIEARPVLAGIGLGTEFEFAIDVTTTVRARGTSVVFTGLKHGTQYTIFARTVNALGVSDWFSKAVTTTSDSADIIDLIGEELNQTVFQPIVDELQTEFNTVITGINNEINTLEQDVALAKQQSLIAERDLKLRINNEQLTRKESDKQLLQTAAEAARLKYLSENIRNAVFEVNPATGQITLKAFNYADSKFTEASVLIDGVNASVNIQASRITATENRVTNAESQLLLQAGQISLRATFTDVNQAIAGAIDAILPAYSFGFFNSAEGWSAVNGEITSANQKLAVSWGDITNQELSYSADDNPLISISILRTGGIGWTGSLIVTYLGGGTVTYPSVIANVAEGTPFVRNLNLAGESSYTGTVTGIRLVLGTSPADTFEISSISIGKPSAALSEIEGITAQVNDLGIEIDAVNASLTNYVTTAFYANNTVTLNNVNTVINGTDAVISLRATQTVLNEQQTVIKANSASSWVNAADANITNVVQTFNAQPGGVNDQLNNVNQNLTIVQNEIDAVQGLSRTQAVSINRLAKKDSKQALEQLLSEYDLYKTKRNLLEVGANVASAEFSIQALATADQALAQSILQLSSSTGTSIGQLNANIQQVNTTLTNQINGVAQSVNTLTVDVNGRFTSTITRVEQVETVTSGNTSAISSLQATVNNPTNGLSATFTLAGQAKATADGAVTSIAGLQAQVSGIDGDLGQAELLLQSTVNSLGVVSARAFLGVTTVTGGNAVINGIVVDGATNTLEFRGNTLRWSDSAGNLQLYASSETGKLIYNGDMVAGTFQTATSGFRAEMTGTGMFPFWYGANAKTLENALFAVDTGGNVTMRNANIQGALVTSNGTGIRNEIVDDGTYLQWVGSSAKNDVNAIFYLKRNGNAFYSGDIRDGASSSSGYSVVTNQVNLTRNVETTIATVVIPAIAGKVINIQAIVNGTTFGAFGTGQTYNTVIRIRRNGVEIGAKTQAGPFSDYEVIRIYLDNPGAGTFTYTLTVQALVTDGDNPANPTLNVKYAALTTQQLRR